MLIIEGLVASNESNGIGKLDSCTSVHDLEFVRSKAEFVVATKIRIPFIIFSLNKLNLVNYDKITSTIIPFEYGDSFVNYYCSKPQIVGCVF